MGQQQLLLVILVTILVGIATVVAINVFGTAADRANVDAVRQDLLTGAAGVQAVWTRPVAFGGAGRNFNEFTDAQGDLANDEALLNQLGMPVRCGDVPAEDVNDPDVRQCSNENGSYELEITAADAVTLRGLPANEPERTLTLSVSRVGGQWVTAWIEE